MKVTIHCTPLGYYTTKAHGARMVAKGVLSPEYCL